MERVIFEAEARTVIGKQVKALRREGRLPAVIYGNKIEPMAISLDFHSTSLVLPKISSSQLVVIEIDGKPHTTLVRERQHDPVTDILLHVDFQEISMTETLRTAVGIDLHGEAPAVSRGGVIVTGLEELMVECLPADLPERISVDISGLMEIGDALYVRDVNVSDKVEILSDPEEMLVLITAPAMAPAEEEEEEAIEDDGAEPEIIERGKREDEEF